MNQVATEGHVLSRINREQWNSLDQVGKLKMLSQITARSKLQTAK